MTKKTVSKKKLVNRFAIVLDTSGSMSSICEETIQMFNQQLDTMKENAKKFDQETTASLVLFGTYGNSGIEDVYINKDISVAKRLDLKTYSPQGGTPMFDGIGVMIDHLERLKGSKDPNVSMIVIVLTDGDENSSMKWTAPKIAKKFKELQATDRWTFAFMLPKNNVPHFLNQFPQIPKGNIKPWDVSREGMRDVAKYASASAAAFYGGRSVGVRSSKSYFTTDASKLTKKDVQNLKDLSARVKIWKVEKECPIKSFVEAKGERYFQGCAFYGLTKNELVQADKQILLVEKGTKKVYGGPDARDLLGLVHTESVPVVPGNHGNWDIYVQSNSTNRKLVRGTNLIYFL